MGRGFDQRHDDGRPRRAGTSSGLDPGKRTLTEQLVPVAHTVARQVAERDQHSAVITAIAPGQAGAGAKAFQALGKEAAKLSAAAVRELVAREARVACRSAVEMAVEKLAHSPWWLALSREEREHAIEIAFYEQMRRYFRGFGNAAKDAEDVALRNVAQETLNVARIGTEATAVEPVAGRLPRNHQYAGKEFPRELLPPKYREKGLRFTPAGYPDFEPYAMTLPDGRKTVRIQLSGSQRADESLSNKAAGLDRTPEGYTWHHVEHEGTMMLVPAELHQVAHTGGRAQFKHRTGMSYGK